MDTKFDFMGYRKIAAGVSIVLVLLSIASLTFNQVEWGLDFTGGSLVEVAYENPVDPEAIRGHLTRTAFTLCAHTPVPPRPRVAPAGLGHRVLRLLRILHGAGQGSSRRGDLGVGLRSDPRGIHRGGRRAVQLQQARMPGPKWPGVGLSRLLRQGELSSASTPV